MEKKIIFLLLMFMQITLFAQFEEFKIVEEGRTMERATANALVISWPKASSKTIKKTWQSYAKKFKGKLKYNGKIGEFFLDNAELKDMSENFVDVTAKIYTKGDGVELAVWFNLGITYLSSEGQPERYPAAEAFLKKFDLLVFAEIMKQQLKYEQKALKKMQKEMKKLEKAEKKQDKLIEKQKKIILKAEGKINESEQEIEELNKSQEKQGEEIETQGQMIDEIKAKLKQAKAK